MQHRQKNWIAAVGAAIVFGGSGWSLALNLRLTGNIDPITGPIAALIGSHAKGLIVKPTSAEYHPDMWSLGLALIALAIMMGLRATGWRFPGEDVK